MIASLRGTLLVKSATELLVEVNGVGYSISIPLSTYEKIGDVNSTVTLLTHLHVREDALQLYGFATEEERRLFKMLLSVSGIGPKMAQSILSGVSAEDLASFISEGNAVALTRIPGIGKKTAERIIVELREKIGRMEMATSLPSASSAAQTSIRNDALMALTSLGFKRSVAEKALRAAIQATNGQDVTLEQLLKAALKHAAGV